MSKKMSGKMPTILNPKLFCSLFFFLLSSPAWGISLDINCTAPQDEAPSVFISATDRVIAYIKIDFEEPLEKLYSSRFNHRIRLNYDYESRHLLSASLSRRGEYKIKLFFSEENLNPMIPVEFTYLRREGEKPFNFLQYDYKCQVEEDRLF